MPTAVYFGERLMHLPAHIVPKGYVVYIAELMSLLSEECLVCVYLTSYDSSFGCKNYLSRNKYFSNSSFGTYFISGTCADIMCSALFVP